MMQMHHFAGLNATESVAWVASSVGARDGGGVMEKFSELLLAVYRASRECDPSEFQETALKLVRPLLDFDSCTWSSCVITPEQGMVFLSAYLFEELPGRVEDYEEVRLQDSLPQPTIARPGVTVNAHMPTLYGAREKAAIRAYSQRYRHQCVLATGIPDPVRGTLRGLVFYRKDAGRPFSEEERQLCQCLVPHLMESLVVSQDSLLLRMNSQDAGLSCSGLADCRGIVQHCGAGFATLFALQWPGWDGIHLPPSLLAMPMPAGQAVFVGSVLTVRLRRIRDLVLLQARIRQATDNLTPRERTVAASVAQGLSYKEIAQHLHLAPATVRNHIQAIHTRLGIHSNTELAALMQHTLL